MTNILVTIIAISTAISVHEFGHAYVAHLLGDDTAKAYGRMTLNPMKHLDPIGLLCMIVFRFGWAKPVPVNSNNFKNYKVGNTLVSLAGALFNVICAVICFIIAKNAPLQSIYLIASTTMSYNVFFASFNLLPLPPLDGWKIISPFIPYKYNDFVYKYEDLSTVIFLVLIVSGMMSTFISPISNFLFNIVFTLGTLI
ncbi:MAG: site-2 protease family protein [Peptostreptococcaceae bacterium]